MPIEVGPSGTLDIENATLRSRNIVSLTSLVAGNDVVRSSAAPTLEVYGDPSNDGGLLPRLELVSNVEAAGSAFTRLTSNAGVFTIQSGTAGTGDSKGDIAFSSIDGTTEHMRIQGSSGNVGVGTDNPLSKLTIGGGTSGKGLSLSKGSDNSIKIGSYLNIGHTLKTNFAFIGINADYDQTESQGSGFAGDNTWTPIASSSNFSMMVINQKGGGLGDLTFNTLKHGTDSSPQALSDMNPLLHLDAGNTRVGIGTVSPGVPLHVNGGNNPNVSTGDRTYFRYDDAALTDLASVWTATTSIYATHAIVCGSYLSSVAGTIGASDERIKKEIVDVEDGAALETLRLLKPKQYKYKDEVQRGTEPVWGFIAQEVRDTLPYATQLRTECLPNIYELANVSTSNVITFTNFDTSNLESNAMVLKVYDVDDKEHLVNIAEVIDGHSVRVDEDLMEWTEDDKIFVYGQQVDDFVFLQKDAIWTVATSALQEVDRQLTAEKARNDALEARILALENA